MKKATQAKGTGATPAPATTPTPAPPPTPQPPAFKAGKTRQEGNDVILEIEAAGRTGSIPIRLTLQKIAEILERVPWTVVTDADAVDAFTDVREALIEAEDDDHADATTA